MPRYSRRPSIFYYDARAHRYLHDITFPTYKELRRFLKGYLENSIRLDGPGFVDGEHEVTVTRYRRGSGFQYVETWQTDVAGNPILIKEGWM